jgi:hypothetical protein
VALLLSQQADFAAGNATGATALHRAARWGHSGAASVLLRAGASTTAADRGGLTPPDWADAKGFFPLASGLRAGRVPPPAGGAGEGEAGSGGGSGDAASPRAVLPPLVPQPGALLVVEGWMAKQGHFFPNWKNRWFVLEGRALSYFTKQGAKVPQGVISLVRGTDLVVEERYAKPFCFTVVTAKKKFILQAANEEEMTEWIESIQNNIIHAPGGEWGPAALAALAPAVSAHNRRRPPHTHHHHHNVPHRRRGGRRGEFLWRRRGLDDYMFFIIKLHIWGPL